MTQHTFYTEKQINQFIKELKNNPDLCQYLLFHYPNGQVVHPMARGEIKVKNKGVKNG